ncbi:hypothetical protein BGZ52_008537, partial [Haplosporangium bisporale]
LHSCVCYATTERNCQIGSGQPDYDFECQLDGLDSGNKITRLYNDVRKQKDLDHTKVDRIA